jgi:ELWxxDGT repeat protein
MKKKTLFLFALVLLLVQDFTSFSQINITRDINNGNIIPSSSANPTSLVVSGNVMFFAARTPQQGNELWKTDGTQAGTVMVKDISPGVESSNPANLVDVNGAVYFITNDGNSGVKLWKSDGTENGTTMIKNFDVALSDNFRHMVNVSGTLFFVTLTPGWALWKSDGTSEGTVVLKDNIGYPDYLTSVNNTLFFSANGGNGTELWKSNGTIEGTVMVKDINPSTTAVNSSNPNALTAVGNLLYFNAYTEATGQELWKSDGTEQGTVLVKDIVPGAGSSEPRYIVDVNGVIFFSGSDGAFHYDLWKTDGTAAGTVMVKDLASGPYGLVNLNGTLFFLSDRGYTRLFKSDGTEAGTVELTTANNERVYTSPVNVNGTLFFEAYTTTPGLALWKSDGTIAGTMMVKDINPQRDDYYFYTTNWRTSFKGSLFFAGYNDLQGSELWRSDGTEAGTNLVKEINGQGDSGIDYVVALADKVVFRAQNGTQGAEVWKSDGTEGGTELLKDINPMLGSSYPYPFAVFNNVAYFVADDGVHGRELWKSDGTNSGTVLVKDGVFGPSSLFSENSFAYFAQTANGLIYFTTFTSSTGGELWRTDGTEAGTYAVTDLPPGSPINSIVALENTIYFAFDDGINGAELWKSNGTIAGTVMVRNINPSSSSSPNGFKILNGKLLFGANDGTNGYELWSSDGTEAGTVLLKNIDSGNGAYMYLGPSNSNNILNGELYFRASDGTAGVELWKTNGTTAGTVMVKDIYQGSSNSYPDQITVVHGKVYFTTGTQSNAAGMSLYRSDGTAAGTELVKSSFLPAGSLASNQYLLLHAMNNTLYAINTDNTKVKTQIWRIDANLQCEKATSKDLYVYQTVSVGNKMFLRAWSYGYGGIELFAYDVTNEGECKKEQTITFEQMPTGKRANDGTFTISATATSGLPVTFTSSNPGVAEVSGTTVTIKSAGETNITANQIGDATWAAAPSVTQKLVIGVILSIGDNESSDVTTSPNPFVTDFNLALNTVSKEPVRINVFTTTGKLIQVIEGGYQKNFQLGESWSKGIYLLRVENGKRFAFRKVVKH